MTTFNAAPEHIDPRVQAARSWLRHTLGDSALALEPASEDASFRRYFRVHRQGTSLVLMDAPPELEPSEAFLRIADWLAQCGVHVPAVHDHDLDQGFLLLEDLGDLSYFAALRARPDRADALYRDAIASLVAIQQGGRAFQQSLPPYDEALLRRELALFTDWLCGTHLGLGSSRAEAAQLEAVHDLLIASALAQPRVFVHRDYHSRNLMVCDERNPGVLDFQDAVAGPISYDLVSLLKDCYLVWPQADRARWIADYHAAATQAGLPVGPADEFNRWLDLMGVQRHLKAAGIFARLYHRDGKAGYLADIPRTLDYVVEVARTYPELGEFGSFVERRVLPTLAARPQ
ncbi:MAG: phosphotransferase [Gammaproteobacteria bacterium]|nr:phosphotransferase [Gammaproteobacteria bacterium]